MVLTNTDAVDVINALASDYPLTFEHVEINNLDQYLESTTESVSITRMDSMTEALKNLPKVKLSQGTDNQKNQANQNELSPVDLTDEKSSSSSDAPISNQSSPPSKMSLNTSILDKIIQRPKTKFTENIIGGFAKSKEDNSALSKDIEYPPSHDCTLSSSESSSTIDICTLALFKKLNPQETHAIDKVLEKLKALDEKLSCASDELKMEEIAQNLAIPERFKYVYLNPDNVNPSSDNSDKPYVSIRLLVNKRVDLSNDNLPAGLFYFSVMIGLFCVEWSEQGFACVRKKDSRSFEMVDIETVYTLFEIDAVMSTVSKVCCEWNSTRRFDSKKCNHQHFVVDILHRLNIMTAINHNRYYEPTELKRKKRTKIKQLFMPYSGFAYFGTWLAISTSFWYKLLTHSELKLSQELENDLLNGLFEEEISNTPFR